MTPSFNQLNWLRLCVSSITDQTAGILVGAVGRPPAFAVEHIIQDAGSAGIEEFAKEVGANFHNGNTLRFEADPSLTTKRPHYSISIYSEPDRGMYDAINKGLAKATGDICAWLNSDEQYLDGTLQKVAEYFRKDQDLDVLLGDAVLVDERFDPLSYRRIVIPNKWHTRLSFLHSLSCAMFFRPRVLPNPALDDRWKIIGDAVLMDHFLSSGARLKACSELLSLYALTGANLSRGFRAEQEAWLRECGFPPRVFRPFVDLHHRIRRFLAGGYVAKRCEFSFYTHHKTKRQRVTATVGGRWPKVK